MPDDGELKLAREQLAEGEELYRQALELSNPLPVTADSEGRILAVGERWRDWTGTDPKAAIGKGWADFVHYDDRHATEEAWRQSVSLGTSFEMELRLRMRDGGFRWVRARASKRTDAPEGRPAWYGTLEDVHERRVEADAFLAAQVELAHVSRLSAIGATASTIAHDLTQPLTAIAHYIRGARKLLVGLDGPHKQDVAEALDDADRSTVRAADIIRRIREFAASGHVETRPEDLSALTKEACRFALVDAAARGVTWRLDAAGAWPVIADRVQVQQMLVNLTRNAMEAMDGQPIRSLKISLAAGPPGFCQVSVRDTGQTISAATADRMFDPFFTTRKGGMGIGLSTSRMIVEAHGGKIWYEVPETGGTRICFTLPTAPTPAAVS